MGHPAAVKIAIDLMHFPSQVRSLRLAPLPDDVLNLIRIAAGDEDATNDAAQLFGRSRNMVRDAAIFYVEQILLFQGADSYRVLAARPDANYEELRRNMAALLRWLHPDRDSQGERAIFAARVTWAWDQLKTQERRAAYDRLQRASAVAKSLTRQKGRPQTERHRPYPPFSGGRQRRPGFGRRHPRRFDDVYANEREGLLRRLLMLLFGRAAL